MADKIDESQVRKVAKLARLDLSEEEITEFTGQLSAILGYVEKMNELNTDDVEPLAHCLPVSNVFRTDSVRESLGTEKALANAPQRWGGGFQGHTLWDSDPVVGSPSSVARKAPSRDSSRWPMLSSPQVQVGWWLKRKRGRDAL